HLGGLPSVSNLGEASLVLFFAFAGGETALTPSGEIHDPGRTIPRAVWGSTVAMVGLYLGLQIVSQGALGNSLGAGDRAPLASVAEQMLGNPGRLLMLICLPVSVLGGLAIGTLGGSRALLMAAEDGMLPKALARVHPE